MASLEAGYGPLSELAEPHISFVERIANGRLGFRRRLWLTWAVLGPGIISLLANNDAGGVISYTMTGAKFGISLFLPLVFLLAPIGYQFQEMSMRLSAVTQRPYSELLRCHFGKFPCHSSIAALVLANLLYIITEFVGMTGALMLTGLPLWIADLVTLILVSTITLLMGYWPKERLALIAGCVNVVFIAAAILSHPDVAAIGRAFTTRPMFCWGFGSNGVLVFIMATIGNTVAPFMLYFQSSATTDRRMTASDLRPGRFDIALGALLQPLFAMAVIVCGAGLLGKIADPDGSSPMDLIAALVPVTGPAGSILFAIGLFNAGWLAATTISLSSAYAIAGTLGSKPSLNLSLREAPLFYGIYFASLLLASSIILIPSLPVNMIAVFTQIIAAILLVPDLIFLVLLTSNQRIMGEYVNRWPSQIAGSVIVLLYACVSAATVYIALATA